MQQIATSYYESLYELAAKVNSAGTQDAVLRYIVKKVTQAMGAKGCSVMLLTPDRQSLMHSTAFGLSERYIRKGPLSVDKSISEALAGKPIGVLDATEDPRIQYHEAAAREGIASILSAPILLRDEIIGVMRVYTAEPHRFTDDDMYFVGAAANLGAIALENAALYQSIEQDYDTLRKDMLEWHAALGYEWATGDSVEVPADWEELTVPTPGF